MPSLLPLLSLAAFAISSASAETLIWSKVDTTKPSATSPLVWSKVNTVKPASTSPIVWVKVETSKSSSSSPSSTSPLVWSKVVTSKPTTTSTPVWSRVITTRAPSTTTLVPSTTSSSSTTSCSINYTASALPSCLGPTKFKWSTVQGYRNYEGNDVDSAMEKSSGFLSGRPCPNFEIRNTTEKMMLLSVSDEFAEMHGGFENICGKELWLADAKDTARQFGLLNGKAVIAHGCSKEFCPGPSVGVGRLYNHPQPLPSFFFNFAFGIYAVDQPDRRHKANAYQWSWIM